MHPFSVFLTTMAIASTALAGSVLETRNCPAGPYKEGSKCSQECEGAHKCSLNLDDVVRDLQPSYPLIPFLPSPYDLSRLLPLYIVFGFTSYCYFSFFCFVSGTVAYGMLISCQIECKDGKWVAIKNCRAATCRDGHC